MKSSEIEGYQPVSRIGEVVINSFIDGVNNSFTPTHAKAAIPTTHACSHIPQNPPGYEFAQLDEHITATDMGANGTNGGDTIEYRPAFHEWATALPGMICLSRKARNATFRNYVAAETATPVVSCAACMKQADEKQL